MRKFVIQVKYGSGNGELEGQYAAPFENGPEYTRDISSAFMFDTYKEAKADCMGGEQVVEVENPATKQRLEKAKKEASFFTIDEMYSDEEILAAAERIRGN